MLTCMAHSTTEKINAKHPSKTLSSQIKDMALKASGAYRHCTPCANQPGEKQKGNHRNNFSGGEPADKSRRTWSSASSGRKELEARLKVISSGDDGTPTSASGRRVVFVEESEPKEWVAQAEPGVLITFLSLPKGGNDLKRVRFSQEVFNKCQAHRWWTDNCEKIMELYNVRRLNRQAFPLPATPASGSPFSEQQPPTYSDSDRPNGYISDSLHRDSRAYNGPDGVATTPKLSSDSGGVSKRASSFRDADRSGEVSLNNGGYFDAEWVEQDEPGVYLTIRALPDGRKELRRVRFSREKFQEIHARLWWEENRARINRQYL